MTTANAMHADQKICSPLLSRDYKDPPLFIYEVDDGRNLERH